MPAGLTHRCILLAFLIETHPTTRLMPMRIAWHLLLTLIRLVPFCEIIYRALEQAKHLRPGIRHSHGRTGNGREGMINVVGVGFITKQSLQILLIVLSADCGLDVSSDHSAKSSTPEKAVPVTPFRVLDAPHLKDDYYCTVLAYSHSHRTLAVALWQKVYLWTEKEGVKYPPIPQARHANFVTSLSFSSTQGGKGILAVSRNSGQVLLWGIDEQWARFEAPHQNSVSCLSFKPSVTCRRSVNGVGAEVACEDLLVGDDTGVVYFYSVEWPDLDNTDLTESRAGAMTLLARVTAHVQNICGLAWCPDGKHFATGGNDNTALFFETARVLERRQPSREASPRGRALRKPDEFPISASSSTNTQLLTPPASPDRPNITGTHDFQSFQTAWETNFTPVPTTLPNTPPQSPPRTETREQTPRPVAVTPLGPRLPLRTPVQIIRQPAILQRLPFPTSEAIQNVHIHAFVHSAAVKALAFAPWQPSLLATGGGSNDRQIHFHHTGSGATLAVINVFAQITCLIWSRTRREIAATFGYAQPEHGVRVAVFAWPSCECVVKIPWEGRNGGSGEVPRALWAVGYPGGPNDGAMPAKSPSGRRQRTDEEQGMAQWEAVRQMERRAVGEIGETPTAGLPRPRQSASPRLTTVVSTSQRSAEMSPSRRAAEGAAWTSRTEEEGSLIIACCDQTVKFFEVWAGSSKSRRGRGLGNKAGVLGGSRILELETAGIFESEDGTGRGSMGAEVIR
jgi:WD domain, G-beta repeat